MNYEFGWWNGVDGSWRGDASEKTWLTAIAVNVCRVYRPSA